MTPCKQRLLSQQAQLEKACAETSRQLKTFPRLANGLTSDAVRNSPEWQAAKSRYEFAFQQLRSFNQRYARILRRG